MAGLNEWEARALVHLLVRGVSKAADIATATKIPSNKIYGVLRDLESQGLAFQPTKAARNSDYKAVHPEELFAILLAKPRKMSLIQTTIQGKLGELYEGALEGVDESRLDSFVAVSDEGTAVGAMLAQGFRTAQKEIIVRGISLQWLTASPALMTQLKSRAANGVKVRAMAQKILPEQRDALFEVMKDRQFEMRESNRRGSPLAIIDGREVYIGIRKAAPKVEQFSDVFIRATSVDLAEDMRLLFDHDWQDAVTVKSEP